MARDLDSVALGVLLTGMGDDGASGLLAVRRAGGYTIAEDESTAVVYGMPGAAVRLGAVCESLPLPAIAARIVELAPARQDLPRHEVH
jgi:two-component system chemotaxis response regulator CheB